MSVFNLPSTINAAGFAGYTLRTGQTSTDAYYDQDGTSTAALRFNISNNNLTFYVNGPGTSGQPSSWTLNGTSASDGDTIVQNDAIVINESGTTGSFTVGNWLTAGGINPLGSSEITITSRSLCVSFNQGATAPLVEYTNRNWYITVSGASTTDTHTVHLGSSTNSLQTLTGNGEFDIGTFGGPTNLNGLVINIKKGSSIKHTIVNTPCSMRKKAHCNFW